MLKITVQNGGATVLMRLEGRVVGPWVAELEHAWQLLAPSLGLKKLSVDLRDVSYVDQTGREILAEMRKESGAEFLADSPLTSYIAEEAVMAAKNSSKER